MTKDVDITPSWQGLVPAMCAVLENPKASFESKAHIQDQIMLIAISGKRPNKRCCTEGRLRWWFSPGTNPNTQWGQLDPSH
mgnify:FL=1